MVEPESAPPRRTDAHLAALSLVRAWAEAEADALHATATGAAWTSARTSSPTTGRDAPPAGTASRSAPARA
ncbi:hypothetical protein NI17_023940 (plasmid) [Thermobifida halotolerans]|uniref:Uncharacterized protein n=1 Tax=Thermobifida halotolerans TaxID=483545 RepID=A0AA97M2D2_9ACTN|nr:hypothetical protein [Thermobifida halotolerans]UOE22303.1 hypothetical protein NI17_023940 [Thermobifida halotolerans]